MIRDNTPEAACQGKARFATKVQADQIHRKRRRDGRHVYHCEFCKGWHLGRRAGKNVKDKRRELTWDERLEFLDA
jgi:hypothetical protein